MSILRALKRGLRDDHAIGHVPSVPVEMTSDTVVRLDTEAGVGIPPGMNKAVIASSERFKVGRS